MSNPIIEKLARTASKIAPLTRLFRGNLARWESSRDEAALHEALAAARALCEVLEPAGEVNKSPKPVYSREVYSREVKEAIKKEMWEAMKRATARKPPPTTLFRDRCVRCGTEFTSASSDSNLCLTCWNMYVYL